MELEKPELLAPVGNHETLEAVIEAGADAVYLGAKQLNMRVRRPAFNFTLRELEEIIPLNRSRGIRTYFTLNSLVNQDQLFKAAELLEFLQVERIDGLIVQDLGVINLARRIAPAIPLHASTQMNIHNSLGAKLLEKLGIKRVVLSRELSLQEISAISRQTKLELEFFVFGSRCISYSGQCYLSSALGGGGGNQGLCNKPCRRLYQFKPIEKEGWDYFLSPKDTSLLSYLPQLVETGIKSFKIEGRMEDRLTLKEIINIFRQAIDNGQYYEEDKLRSLTGRNLTQGYLVDRPGKDYFELKGGKKKNASQLHQPFTLSFENKNSLGSWLRKKTDSSRFNFLKEPLLAVWIKDQDGFRAAWEGGADIFYLGGEHLRSWGSSPTPLSAYLKLIEEVRVSGKKVYLALPNIAKDQDLMVIESFLKKVEYSQFDGLLVSSLGTLALARQQTNLPLSLDQDLNIFNLEALEILNGYNIERFCLHPEGNYQDGVDSPYVREIVIWGHYPGMVLESCLIEDFLSCNSYCGERRILLKSLTGQLLRVETDLACRTHLFPQKKLNLIRSIPCLKQAGIGVMRIDGRWIDARWVKNLVRLCKEKIAVVRGN